MLQDDCELTTRMVEGKNPVRIVLDSKCSLPVNSKILNGEARTIVAVGENPSLTNFNALKLLKNVEVIELPENNGKLDLTALMKYLEEQEITSLLVEGGSEVHGAFWMPDLPKGYMRLLPLKLSAAGMPFPRWEAMAARIWAKRCALRILNIKSLDATF